MFLNFIAFWITFINIQLKTPERDHHAGIFNHINRMITVTDNVYLVFFGTRDICNKITIGGRVGLIMSPWIL